MTEREKDNDASKQFTDEYIQRQKGMFLNEFFITEKRNYHKDNKFINKLVDVRYEPKENIPRTLIFTLFNQYKFTFNNDWDEFISVVMSIVADAVGDYVPKLKNFDWTALNESESRSNLHLKTHITNRLKQRLVDASRREQGQTYGQVTVNEGGKKVKYRTIIDKQEESTDAVIDDGEKNKTSMINTLENDNKYGYQHSLYYPNHFLQYFRKNQNNKGFLTKNQNEYLEIMPKFLHQDGSSYTLPYNHDPTQYYNENRRTSNRRAIKNKVFKLYTQDYANGDEITFLQMKKEADLSLLNELIHIVYESEYDHVSELNEYISNWVHEQLNNDSNTILSNLLHDELETNEMIQLNTILHNGLTLGNRLIYEIVELVENKIEQLEQFDTTVKQEKVASTSNWTKDDHQKYRDYLHSFKKQPTKVYDLKTGKLIRKEKYVPYNKRNYKVYNLDVYGMQHEVGEHDVGID